MSTCFKPFTVTDENKRQIPVPCGKCPSCISRRISGWCFRIQQEYKVSHNALFVTLTYGDGKADRTENGFLTLNKKHLQDFFKRLRHECPLKVKYFVCGEYGGKKGRPHYHAIIFNASIEAIEKTWQQGRCHYGEVNAASVQYVLKYMDKAFGFDLKKHSRDDRLREFQLQSKGLGLSYVNERTVKYHTSNLEKNVFLTIEDGKKIAMPRYYKLKIYDKEQSGKLKGHFENQANERLLAFAMEATANGLSGSEYTKQVEEARRQKLEKARESLLQRVKNSDSWETNGS